MTDQPLLKCREQGVIRQAQFRHGAVAQAFGGDERQAALATRVGAQMGHRFAAEADRCALVAGQPFFTAEQGQQFVLAIAGDPGDADDFAAAHFKVDVFQRTAERVGVVPGQVFDLQEGLSRRAPLDNR